MTQQETRKHYSESLEDLRQGIVQMASLVEDNLLRAGSAMSEGRLGLVEIVQNADEDINRVYAELERDTFMILARQQPVAGDLRFLVAATRMLYEIERSGDLVVNCVKAFDRQHGFPDSPRIHGILARLIDETAKVWRMGIDAVADMDEQAGYRIDEADDVVDDLVGEYYGAVAAESDDFGLETAISLSRVGRFLERIADHAVNIGENVTYIVSATFPGDTHASLTDEYEKD